MVRRAEDFAVGSPADYDMVHPPIWRTPNGLFLDCLWAVLATFVTIKEYTSEKAGIMRVIKR